MSKEEFKRKFNVNAKQIFREWLTEAININDFESFKECVLCIGNEWHVARTIEKEEADNFVEELWENKEKIQNGEYTEWAISYFDAYSYESKVCFLINPKHYRLIYDGNNKKNLSKTIKKRLTPKEWQSAVDDYYNSKNLDAEKLTEEEIFEIDYDLWSNGNL